MIEIFLFILCGLTAGLLAGYLGLGGGIVMVPFLTIVLGMDFKTAVPVSTTAIVVNSISASNEYLKKGMVNIEMVVILSIFMVMGNIAGSNLNQVIPSDITRIIFTLVLLYTAVTFLKSKKESEKIQFSEIEKKTYSLVILLALFAGVMAGLLGIGGGVIIVPMLYLLVGLPLTTSRGTSILMVGFSSAAGSAVYFLNDMINFKTAAAVIVGIIIGGKVGGYLGTLAKPKIVKIIFFIVMIYLAFKLSYEPLMELL